MSIADMVNEGVRRAYLDPDNTLRASIVADPAGSRKNTKDNTPAVVHFDLVPGDTVDVKIAAKGGGSENKSKFAMLNPSDSIVDWVLKTVPTMGAGWCPPGMLGIGIGGSAEKAMLLAKESLMEPIDMHALLRRGPRDGIEELRVELYEKVNALGIGAQGLGGLSTVLDVKILDYPTHAASKPIGMIPNCAATRHAHFTLDGYGRREARAAGPRALAQRAVDSGADRAARRSRPPDARRGRDLETRRDAAPFGQDADGARRRAQAHCRSVREERRTAAGGRLHQPRDLLRRSGRPGARRGRRPRRSDDGDPDGQVHGDDAREDGSRSR